MRLTAKEKLVLNAIARDLYAPTNGGYPTTKDDFGIGVWTFSVADTIKKFMAPRSLPGVVASLTKKGLAYTGGSGAQGDEFYMGMTDAGIAAWQAAFPTKELSDNAGGTS